MKLSGLNRKILALAIPSIAANITTPLLGLVDTAIAGHMGSAVFLAAIAVGSVMFNMVYWFFSFLRAGTSGLAGQACGAADTRAWRSSFYNGRWNTGCCGSRRPTPDPRRSRGSISGF